MDCKLALNNSGSRLGAFGCIKTLALDYLKTDGTCMRSTSRDADYQTMVTALIKFARMRHFKLIAEQVEDQGSLEAARTIGIDFICGHAIGWPQPLHRCGLAYRRRVVSRHTC